MKLNSNLKVFTLLGGVEKDGLQKQKEEGQEEKER